MAQIIFGEGNGMTGADNGRVARNAATYAGLSSASNIWVFSDIYNYTERYLSGGTYQVTIGLYRFNTASLPDSATVTSASFVEELLAATDADTRNFVLGWVTWDGTSTSDWSLTPTTNAHSGTSVTTLLAGGAGDKTFALSNLSNINKSGYTYLKAWIDGGAPTGVNNANYAAVDNTTDPGPRLIVNYTLPAPTGLTATVLGG